MNNKTTKQIINIYFILYNIIYYIIIDLRHSASVAS